LQAATLLLTATSFLFGCDAPVNEQLLVGSRGGEGACIFGLKDMTPQQSYERALPWVGEYGAPTNEERGHGLADDVFEA